MTNIAREALAVLNGGENWYQGDMSNDEHTKFCSVGALWEVYSSGSNIEDTERMLNKVAAEQYPDRVDIESDGLCNIAAVNDHPDTVWADIERLFEKVAVQMEEQV